ncbi:MAG: hypothetical protein Q9185_000346 [Variospora sp. 1 TL-2023]
MDSPDRMSWTPSSSAKKRKYNDFVEACVHIRIPGTFPQSPEYKNIGHRSQYMLSPSPSSSATPGFVHPRLAAQVHAPMLDYRNLPEPFRRLYQMAATTGTKTHAMSSSAIGLLAGPSRQALRYVSDCFGPLCAAVETIGNSAKRIKLSFYSPPAEAEVPPKSLTPPQRISNLVNRTPTPGFRTQASILRNTRETDIRKARKTLRWVEDQQVVSEASNEMIQQQISQSPFQPVMSGALPFDSISDDLDTAVFDDADVATSSSSDVSDSVTSSMAEGLDAEDLQGIETREEKKLRKRREALEKAAAPSRFASQLRTIHNTSSPISKPLTQRVVFYDSPTSGCPVTLIKEYSSEDALTPPIRPHSATIDIKSRPAIKARSVSRGLSKPPAKDGRSLNRLLNTAVVSPPVTPEAVGRDLSTLSVSQRRSSTRLDQLAIQAQQERDAEAAKAAQRAAEDAEERTRFGVRRMPTGPVILPLTEEWDNKVNVAMGKRTEVEVAKTSLGEIITRRDFGRVLPVRGVDPDTSGWLNDAIISAYIQAAVDYGQKMRDVKRGTFPKVHAFNTYFYNNLSTRGYNSVRRWATKAKFGGKDILKMEKIFIPINIGGQHWVLALVNPQAKTIEYFDSFHSPGRRVVDNIKTWLAAELKDAFVDAEWTVLEKQGPKQYNAVDCGVFCATTAKMIVLGVDPMAFSAEDMATQRRVMLAELLNGGFEGDFTPKIRF